jgi:hypothetical protein
MRSEDVAAKEEKLSEANVKVIKAFMWDSLV